MVFYIESGTGRQVTSGFDPNKFYIESGTGKQVSGSQLAGSTSAPSNVSSAPQSAPQSPTPSTAPQGFGLGGFKPAPSPGASQSTFLPPTQSGGQGGSLLDFANAVDAATNMAKQKRNAGNLEMMMPQQGTLMASDFNGILSNLNRASDSTASNLTNRAIEAATPQYQTTQIGNEMYQIQYDASGRYMGAQKIATVPKDGGGYTYDTVQDGQGNIFEVQYDETGKMIGERFAAAAGPNTVSTPASAKPMTSGGLTISADEKQEMYTILQTGKSNGGTPYGNAMGQDGFVDPAVYLQLMDQWRLNGGLLEDFTKDFPPEQFINPANTWVGTELKKRGVKWGKEPAPASGGYSATEKRKLEQQGLLNAPRQQQLDALYGNTGLEQQGLLNAPRRQQLDALL